MAFGSAMPEAPGRVLSVLITIWDNTKNGSILVSTRQVPIRDESQDVKGTVRWLIWMDVESERKNQPQDPGSKTEPGALSASLKMVSG